MRTYVRVRGAQALRQLAERDAPAGSFNRAGTGLQHWCRECFRDYFRRRGAMHRRAGDGSRRTPRGRGRATFMDAYLPSASVCRLRRARPAACSDFDHRRREARAASASLVARGAPCQRIDGRDRALRGPLRELPPARHRASGRLVAPAGNVDDPQRGFSAPVRRNLNHVHRILAVGDCVDCGERDMLVLEFDHVGDKRGQISRMVVQRVARDAEAGDRGVRAPLLQLPPASRPPSAGVVARKARTTVSVEPP